MEFGRPQMVVTPKALDSKAQGKRSAALGMRAHSPYGFHPERVGSPGRTLRMQRLRRKDRIAVSLPFPRVRCATLGFGMQRLRRKENPWLVACGNYLPRLSRTNLASADHNR